MWIIAGSVAAWVLLVAATVALVQGSITYGEFGGVLVLAWAGGFGVVIAAWRRLA